MVMVGNGKGNTDFITLGWGGGRGNRLKVVNRYKPAAIR